MQGALNPKAILLVGVMGVSVSSILVRWSQAPSLVTATYRLGWTVLILLPVVLLRCRAELKAVKLRDLALCFASGAMLALHFATWFESLRWTSIASSTVVVSTEVIFTAIGFALFLKGKIPRLGIAAIALAFAGSALLALSDGGGGGALYGDLLALLGAIFVSCYSLIGRVQRGHLSTSVYTFLTYASCLVVLLLLDFGTGTPVFGYGGRSLLVGLGLAVLCTLLGHSLFNWCLKYLSPAYTASVKLLEPVFAALLGIPLFGELPKALQLAGGAVILAGVLLYNRAERGLMQ